MENKICQEDYLIIEEIAIRKTTFLKHIPEGIDDCGYLSFKTLSEIITGDDTLIYKRIIMAHSQLSKISLGSQQFYRNSNPYMMKNSAIVWGRMYIIAYYFYHDDLMWKKQIFADIMEFILYPDLQDEISRSEKLIDEYYSHLRAYQQDELNTSKKSVPTQKSETKCFDENISAGRPLSHLFLDEKRENIEKERLISYLKSHNLYSKMLNVEKDDKQNKIIRCFCWQWKKLHYTDKLTGTALCRFLTDKCQMKLSIDPKSYANRMTEMLRKEHFFEDITGEIKEIFSEELYT